MSDGTCCLCSQTVFVRSTKNFVYRSKDEGKNWEKQNWKMEKAGTEEEGSLMPHLLSRTQRTQSQAHAGALTLVACAQASLASSRCTPAR